MHSIRPRPICRARNTFSPSTALWQHFVAPSQHLPQRPPTSSFTIDAAQNREDREVGSDGEGSAVKFKGIRFTAVSIAKSDKWVDLRPNRKDEDDGQGKRVNPGYRGEKGQDLQKILSQTYEAYELEQDYEGVTVQPVYSVPVKESKYPWVIPNRETIQSGEERLNLEIKRFHEYVRPSQAEIVARKHAIEQVRQHVREVVPKYVLEVFGSERTGMAFAGSDIDLRLIPEDVMSDTARSKLPPSPQERVRRRADLMKLHRHLVRCHRHNYLLPTIRWARYPLISLQDRTSGLDIQVVLSNDTSISRDYMHRYMQEYPYLPELYSVIKATLDVRGLSDVFRGGIGSYSLFMMIVASLKHKPHPNKDAAGALEYFLRFWAHFKADRHGLSIEPPELFAKPQQVVMHEKAIGHLVEGKTKPLPPWMPTIRDPADGTNDLGRKIVAWKHIRTTFRSLSKNLRTEVAQNTRVSLIARLVGPIYALQREHRKKLANYGRSLVQASRQHTPADHGSQTTAEADLRAHAASRGPPNLDDLAAIARTIRDVETAHKPSAHDAEALSTAEVGDGMNPWLKDTVGAADHKETEKAFSDLLGLDKKLKVHSQEK